MKKALVLLLLTFILISFAAQTDQGDSNATRAIILYNMAISQMSMGDYTDAFKNLKEARELLPTIGSVVDGFQKIYDDVKYHYTKQMIIINKLGIATNTSVKKTEEKITQEKSSKPLFIYGLLGFLSFFVATYSLLYFVEIKNSMISGFFVSTVVALAAKYGYAPKVDEDGIESEDSGEIIEIEEVDQDETDQVEHKIAPEDVEDENVEEILSQLLGINEEEPTSEEMLEEERESEEELSQEETSSEDTKSESSQENNGSESSKDLSDNETVGEKTYALKIEEIKDPRNDMLLTIDRLKDELHQIVAALREKEITNQDDLDNALKIMYVYATTSQAKKTIEEQSNEEGGEDSNDK
jgi:hypothetical protein